MSMVKKTLIISLIILFSFVTKASSKDRILWYVERSQVIEHIENTVVPMFLSNSKCVYWQFYDGWSFSNYTDKTEIRLDGDSVGLANCWSYGYYDGSSNVQFNVVSDGDYIYPFYLMASGVNLPFINTDILFQSDKYLPEEKDWKTCKEFLTQLVTVNPDFYETYWNALYGGPEVNSIVAVTLGYPANDFAGQNVNNLVWSIALIDTVAGNIDYCYADAYNLENIYCNTYSSIKEQTTVTNLQIFPNPSNTVFTLTGNLEAAGNLTVTLNDLLGSEILELHNTFENMGVFTKTFSLETLPKGTYYLKILHNGNVKIEKVIRN